MKTQNKHTRPFHLHLEYFFRQQYCLLAMLALLGIAIVRADSKTLSVMKEAYLHGYGTIGQFMREETSRVPVTFEVAARIPTYSGK